jgi:hypothetical protein
MAQSGRWSIENPAEAELVAIYSIEIAQESLP